MAAQRTLAEEFREIRRAATPWVCITTSDYRVTVKELLAVRLNGEKAPPAVIWDCINGPRSLNPTEEVNLGDADMAPFMVLKNALQTMPDNGILFWVVPDSYAQPNHHWESPFTGQAVANLRDEFKTNRRTLVILSLDGKLPPLFADDVPLLRDPLPNEAGLLEIVQGLVANLNSRLKEAGKKASPVKSEDIATASKLCRGMNRFAAEEAVSRHLSAKQGIDLESLRDAQRLGIEKSSEKVLTFERGGETFDDIGGLDQIKKFSTRLFSGRRPPTVVVRIEEIEKAMAGSGGGGIGDSTGTSQDQLGVLLGCMEDYEWTGLIAVGPAGSGKSLISKAMGNSNRAMTLNLDLGAAKSKWLGDSEGRIRKSMDIAYSVGGKEVFFIATSNGLNNIPPELRRRFKFGIWFFDLLNAQERRAVWSINMKKYNIEAGQEMPDDIDWVGSDIRNVCDLADRLQCPLREAAEFIVPVAKSSPDAVARLRDSADGKFLSASEPGPYRKPGAKTGRAVSL